MYRSEKQLTTKQAKKTYEEVYFEGDFDLSRYNDNSGFLLTYPNKFSQNPSQDKSIGMRRIDVIPDSHFLYLAAEFLDGEQIIRTQMYRGEYVSGNSLQEILVDISNNLTHKNNDGTIIHHLGYTYDALKGSLSLYGVKIDGHQDLIQRVQVRLVCLTHDDYLRLWSILNQLSDTPFDGYLQDNNFNEDSLAFVDEYRFTNAWNRTPLYFHASFSDSKHHYVCKTNDYWEKPAKLFYDNVNGLEFTVYFTTDGVHKIVPRWGEILLELSFILRTQAL